MWFCVRYAQLLDAGGCPAAGNFILLVQNRSNQTKRHPPAPALRASLDFPQRPGGYGNSRCALRQPQPTAPDLCGKSRRHRGGLRAVLWARSRHCRPSPQPSPRWGEGVVAPSPSRGRLGWGWGVFFGPLGPPPSSAAKPGDFCEDCLSA